MASSVSLVCDCLYLRLRICRRPALSNTFHASHSRRIVEGQERVLRPRLAAVRHRTAPGRLIAAVPLGVQRSIGLPMAVASRRMVLRVLLVLLIARALRLVPSHHRAEIPLGVPSISQEVTAVLHVGRAPVPAVIRGGRK